MSETNLSPIDRYRAQWKPDEARVGCLQAEYYRAELEGDIAAMRNIHELLWYALMPPRHLPIKNLDRVE